MTFARMLITAWVTSSYVEHPGGEARAIVLACAAVLWWFCAPDPLPDAIERGLDAYARRYRDGRAK